MTAALTACLVIRTASWFLLSPPWSGLTGDIKISLFSSCLLSSRLVTFCWVRKVPAKCQKPFIVNLEWALKTFFKSLISGSLLSLSCSLQLYWSASPDRVQECLMAGKDPEVIQHTYRYTHTNKLDCKSKATCTTVNSCALPWLQVIDFQVTQGRKYIYT